MKLASALAAALFAFTFGPSLRAEIDLPPIFGDSMVLQRDMPISVWGSASPNATVAVSLGEQSATITADADGKWQATLPALPAGGPLVLAIESDGDTIELKDVLMGDVWLCSGQSNMEWPLSKSEDAEAAIEQADFPQIRHFEVPKDMAFSPRDRLPGGEWQRATPETAGAFTAVGYFFGRKIHQETGVPIGLIHSTWGGTGIETWTSWEVMSPKSNYTQTEIDKMEREMTRSEAARPQYEAALRSDPGLSEKWYSPRTDTADWKSIKVPQEWGGTPIGGADGIVWYRLDFELPAEVAGQAATLSLGPIDDADQTYLNGELVGSTDAYDAQRRYEIEPGVTRAGSNVLVVQVTDFTGGGGFYGKREQVYLEADGQRIPLAGDWRYKPSVLTTDFGIVSAGPNAFPSLLYNAMIHPLARFPIKGVIWYQGENNVQQAYAYRERFPAMIRDWRALWGETFPFYWAQLSTYQKPFPKPIGSAWGELREAQDMALSLPETGQAILIDLGEDDGDIHPRNKLDVGRRLALVALAKTYGKDVMYSGPRYESMSIEGNKIVLRFDHVANGLLAKGSEGELRHFAIAGADKQFKWGHARIEGDTVVVSHPDIKKPVAVRYAWHSNPQEANLYNSAGLPAAPFRTDDWPGETAVASGLAAP